MEKKKDYRKPVIELIQLTDTSLMLSLSNVNYEEAPVLDEGTLGTPIRRGSWGDIWYEEDHYPY